MKKLITILCHPSYIGMYLADKIQQALLFLTFFFVIATALYATKDLLTPISSPNVANKISEIVLAQDSLKDTKYENHKLNGSKAIIDIDGVYVIFNDSAYVNNNNGLVLILVFSQSEANGYYRGRNLGKFVYEDSNIENFTFENIKSSNDSIERMKLEVFVLSLLNSIELNYRSEFFWNDFLNMLILYLVTLVVCYIGSIIRNPEIDAKVRRKLVLYDTIIFFLFSWFEVLYGVYWLQYVGMGLALIYTVLTFSRIKKVSYRKVG